jgi:predicted RNase H-like nuclease (RuvC/YqgF family)
MTSSEYGIKKVRRRLSPDERRIEKLERRVDSLEDYVRKLKTKIK